MDTPPKQTILFDNTVKLRAEFNEFKKEFDNFSVAQNEFNIAQHKINNVILKYILNQTGRPFLDDDGEPHLFLDDDGNTIMSREGDGSYCSEDDDNTITSSVEDCLLDENIDYRQYSTRQN